jgi:hypothetical protein
MDNSSPPPHGPARHGNEATGGSVSTDASPTQQITSTNPSPAETSPLKRFPRTLPNRSRGDCCLTPSTGLIIQFFPSGVCVSLPLKSAVVLGRTATSVVHDTLNLAQFNGERHGVSRQHCLLKRRGTRLVIADLGSTNGTYLNERRLVPHREYVVADGDHIILGTLHVSVFFNTLDSDLR